MPAACIAHPTHRLLWNFLAMWFDWRFYLGHVNIQIYHLLLIHELRKMLMSYKKKTHVQMNQMVQASCSYISSVNYWAATISVPHIWQPPQITQLTAGIWPNWWKGIHGVKNGWRGRKARAMWEVGWTSRGGRCIVRDASFAQCFAIFWNIVQNIASLSKKCDVLSDVWGFKIVQF